MSLFAVPWVSASIDNISDLESQLSQYQVIRGDFTQNRHLDMFKQPLESEGQFVLDKMHGLLWQQSTPFPVNLVLTENKLRQTFASQAPQVINANENPMAFYFSQIFLSVFHGDSDKLKQQFALEFEANSSHWTLNLTPIHAPLNAVFQTITLQGNSYIDALTLTELRGDKTKIRFTNQTHQPEALTDDEQKQFEF
ncbi:outer membrane lipoprotein carrier protein LolA [uncultured Vibrio sp.]|uniref:outer membrane lipoprotein carrier protein LolA n=1 Tax=uncultured Vibrio sp. TaxID=114054 RepID=UPI0025F0F70C|nr:outer membrane lipoprotein carrier protein LolA [uncultured Vibrio sp.]